ncbi:MAG: recombinase RecT [Anaeroplasma sp.]
MANITINQIDEMVKNNSIVIPKDYNFSNAIKMSMLKIVDTKDKNGKSALEVCKTNSIRTCLFKMVTNGLNAGYDQCYFIVRGDILCLHPSYFGKITMAKRIKPDWDAVPVVIYEGDEFEFETDPKTGKRNLIKHKSKLENYDNDFVGGYMYLPDGDLYVMTKKQIMSAWMQSSNKTLSVHKSFLDKMVKKTIINTGLTSFINSSPALGIEINDNEENTPNEEPKKFTDYTDISDNDEQNNVEIPKNLEPKPEEPAVKKLPKSENATTTNKVNENIDDDF